MTSIQVLQASIDTLKENLGKQQHALTEAHEKVRAAQQELEAKEARLHDSANEAAVKIAKLQAEIERLLCEQCVTEFFEVAAALDQKETPALVAKFQHLVAQLRSYRKIGQSHQATTLTIERLRGIKPDAPPLPINMRSWSAIARAWCHQPPAKAA